MTIVLFEDDHVWVKMVKQKLEPVVGADILPISTEFEFRQRLEELCRISNIFVLDIMVRWTDAAEVMPKIPPEIEGAGFYRAGFRCAKLIAKERPSAWIFLLTILDGTDVQKDVDELLELTGKVKLINKNDLGELAHNIMSVR